MSSDLMFVCQESRSDYRSAWDEEEKASALFKEMFGEKYPNRFWLIGDNVSEEAKKDKVKFDEECKKRGIQTEHVDYVFLDECSMGEAWSDFGKYVQERWNGVPGMFEQMAGVKELAFKVLEKEDVDAIIGVMNRMGTHETINKVKVEQWLRDHIGKHVCVENW